METERSVSRMNLDSLNITDWSTPPTDEDPLVSDWRIILASARLRKFRQRETAQALLQKTNFRGYRFFDR